MAEMRAWLSDDPESLGQDVLSPIDVLGGTGEVVALVIYDEITEITTLMEAIQRRIAGSISAISVGIDGEFEWGNLWILEDRADLDAYDIDRQRFEFEVYDDPWDYLRSLGFDVSEPPLRRRPQLQNLWLMLSDDAAGLLASIQEAVTTYVDGVDVELVPMPRGCVVRSKDDGRLGRAMLTLVGQYPAYDIKMGRRRVVSEYGPDEYTEHYSFRCTFYESHEIVRKFSYTGDIAGADVVSTKGKPVLGASNPKAIMEALGLPWKFLENP